MLLVIGGGRSVYLAVELEPGYWVECRMVHVHHGRFQDDCRHYGGSTTGASKEISDKIRVKRSTSGYASRGLFLREKY